MTTPETQPTTSKPERRWLRHGLPTLLLLFVVLASSLAVRKLGEPR